MIGPLVKAAKHPKKWSPVVTLYTLCTSLSAMCVGATVGFLGSIVMKSQWQSAALLVVAIIGIVLALADFELIGTHTPTLRRQTCPVWWWDYGSLVAAALWGFDLGLGFSTVRVASLYWVILLVIFVGASPLIGATVLVGYGIALPVNLIIGIIGLQRFGHTDAPYLQALQMFRPLKIALGIILLVWSLMIALIVFPKI